MSTKQTEVFVIHGVEPETLAYAMAKYSRSALSMKDSLASISGQKAADFLDTFYFQYGHRSIADMAHVTMALENISLLAAIEVVDEQRWDGQERSTRYQDFSKREYYTPPDLNDVEAALYHKSILQLFDKYDELFLQTVEHFRSTHPKPDGMDEKAYERTLRARSFDVARSLLPMATLTSVGQVVSARTLETQISRLFASPFLEVTNLAAKMRQAAIGPAFIPDQEVLGAIASEIRRCAPDDLSAAAIARAAERRAAPVNAAPTLVKHVEMDTCRQRIRAYVKQQVAQRGVDRQIDKSPVETVRTTEWGRSPEVEIIATLLYEHTHYAYHDLLRLVDTRWRITDRTEFLDGVLKLRGRHDELPRAFRTGGIAFDIYMDIGGFRDLHRHRRTQQFFQEYVPEDFAPVGVDDAAIANIYSSATQHINLLHQVFRELRRMGGKVEDDAAYLLPLGTRRRFLMKMDVAEAAYIAELRTQESGHISYRSVAWEMFQGLRRAAPAIADGIADRVVDPGNPIDFFRR